LRLGILALINMPKYKIFLIFLLSFIAGIVLASFVKIDFFIIYCFILASILFLFFFWSNKILRFSWFVLIFICLGILRYNLSWPVVSSEKVYFYNNERVVLIGEVVEINQRIGREEIIFETKIIKLIEQEKKVNGRVLIFAPLYAGYQYGDQLKIECKLSQPQPIEDFQYHEYLAKQNIYSTCFPKEIEIIVRDQGNFLMKWIYKIRDRVQLAIEQNFSEPEGSILSALLLGVKTNINDQVRQSFSATGTAHVLAISGLHIMILVNLLIGFGVFCLGLSRPKAFYFVVLFLIFYVILTGAPASAIRASLLGVSFLLAEKIGRKGASSNLLIFIAFLMLLVNPKLLKSDIGFQLSFAAAFGIVILEKYFLNLFIFLKKLPEKLQPIRNYLAATCSAYLFSLPLVLFYFGNLSLSAPLANILILPVIPILMSLSFLFAFGSLIYFGLAKILVWPAWLILHLIVWLIKNIASIPFLSFSFGKINIFVVVFLYLSLFIIIWQVKKREKIKKIIKKDVQF